MQPPSIRAPHRAERRATITLMLIEWSVSSRQDGTGRISEWTAARRSLSSSVSDKEKSDRAAERWRSRVLNEALRAKSGELF